jgi:hypothetical protein
MNPPSRFHAMHVAPTLLAGLKPLLSQETNRQWQPLRFTARPIVLDRR